MQTAGNYLRKEREAKNISLREAAQLTRIPEFYLNFLEKDDYKKLPQGPYIKGYISSYARLIGSNADEAIKLYNSLQEQMNQTEAAPNDRPETVVRPVSIASFGEKIASSIKDLAGSLKSRSSSLKIGTSSSRVFVAPFKKISAFLKIAGSRLKTVTPSSDTVASSLKTAAGASINTIGSSILKGGSSLKKITPLIERAGVTLDINRRLLNRRTWLYACLILVSSGILVLAGFGFYHLLIYQKNPTPVAKVQPLQDEGAETTYAANTGKKAEPSKTQTAAKSSVQPVEIRKGKALSSLIEVPAGLKKLALPSDPTAGVSRDTSVSERTGIPSRSASSKSVQPLKTALPTGKTASGEVAAGKDITAESRQRPMPAQISNLPSTLANLDVAEANICENVKNRRPAGVRDSFPWSTPRVYVCNLVKAKKFPSKIRHIYYFGGQKISDIALNVLSSSWRTWSYHTISDKRYIGPWRVDITTAEGQVLRRLYFEVN